MAYKVNLNLFERFRTINMGTPPPPKKTTGLTARFLFVPIGEPTPFNRMANDLSALSFTSRIARGAAQIIVFRHQLAQHARELCLLLF